MEWVLHELFEALYCPILAPLEDLIPLLLGKSSIGRFINAFHFPQQLFQWVDNDVLWWNIGALFGTSQTKKGRATSPPWMLPFLLKYISHVCFPHAPLPVSPLLVP